MITGKGEETPSAESAAEPAERWEVRNPDFVGIFYRIAYVLNVTNYAIPFRQFEAYAYGYAERESMRTIDLFDAVRVAGICAAGGEKSDELAQEYRRKFNERAFKRIDLVAERLEKLRSRTDEWERQERWERRMRKRGGE